MKGIWIRGKGGAALITAIVFVFFLTLFGLAFYRLGETDIDLFGYDKKLSKALYASEAGFDKVRWMLRESQKIAGANPFATPYNQENALSIANPTGGDFFPGEEDKAYFKVTEITAELLPTGLPGSRVKVQAFGSVDLDADGEGGLTPLGEGKFDPDPDDVNRRFEARIGLPGTLGERIGGKGISAAAGAFYAGGDVTLSSDPRSFTTPDGDSMTGFLYYRSYIPVGIWDKWGFIFSDPVITGDVELPPGIFDTDGTYIDEDNNGIPDYFQDLSRTDYMTGDKTFTSSPDPTGGRSVVYVKGNIIIDGVDFGYLDDEGVVRNCDWDPTNTDLTFIADGNITVKRVDCGNVGRLVLVAKNIILEGDYNTKVNGIAIASNDITLDGGPFPLGGSWCEYGILTHGTDYSRPVRYAAYFSGTMVAGNNIVLQDDGWAVIYDENVINGYMYSTTLPKPTLTYERVEAEDFNTTNNWDLNGDELKRTQEDYTQEDIINARADYSDGGPDDVPDLMKMYQQPGWHAADDDHDFAVTDGVDCDFTDVGNVFEDSDINIGPQDWDNYTTIRFYMALDNWEKISGSKKTYRKSLLQVLLEDTAGNKVRHNIPYRNNDWVGAPGKAHWEPVRINLHDFDPLEPFDSRSVQSIEFYWKKIEVSWYIAGETESIAFINDHDTGYGDDGYYQYIKSDGSEYPVWFQPPDANGRQLYYTDLVLGDQPIRWNWDPSTSTLENMYFEDTLDPLKSALVSVFKIDRIELPGKPAANNHLQYGLPHSLRLEVTNWQEL